MIDLYWRRARCDKLGVQENTSLLEMSLLRLRMNQLNCLGDPAPWPDLEPAFFENLPASRFLRSLIIIDPATREKPAQRCLDNCHACAIVLDHDIRARAHNVTFACHALPEYGNAIQVLLLDSSQPTTLLKGADHHTNVAAR